MNDIFDEKNKELESAILYKVGDTVIIHPDIRPTHKGKAIVLDMMKYAGKKAKITEIKNGVYKISIDHGCWSWQDYMFLNDKIEPMNEQEVWSML